ncbi:MAG: DUF3343 domain-containing protein [Clostridiales bacterium]|jgi:hypothetical protein|nr:DUF3343 domain-containing protein [Clostridiales bacterium]
MYKLFTFQSTHQAILAEKTLSESGVLVKIIPVPRAISASCGLSARVLDSDFNRACDLLNSKNIQPDGLYSIDESFAVRPFEA